MVTVLIAPVMVSDNSFISDETHLALSLFDHMTFTLEPCSHL